MIQEKYSRYRLIDYFDVWGNEKDGYEVNNQCILFDDLHMSQDITDQEILDYLKSIGYLNTAEIEKFYIISDCDYIELFQADNMYPLCRLELVD